MGWSTTWHNQVNSCRDVGVAVENLHLQVEGPLLAEHRLGNQAVIEELHDCVQLTLNPATGMRIGALIGLL